MPANKLRISPTETVVFVNHLFEQLVEHEVLVVSILDGDIQFQPAKLWED